MASITKDEALRAIAERVNWQGDDGLRDAVLEVLSPDDSGDLVGAETPQLDGPSDPPAQTGTTDDTAAASGRRRAGGDGT
jgi:hypothetical protein